MLFAAFAGLFLSFALGHGIGILVIKMGGFLSQRFFRWMFFEIILLYITLQSLTEILGPANVNNGAMTIVQSVDAWAIANGRVIDGVFGKSFHIVV